MGTFVTGNTALPSLKQDAYPPSGLTTELDAADINNLWSAAGDLRDQTRGWLNAKSSAFGAKGDGATDDTSALQAFFNALAAASGTRGVIPEGTYLVSSQQLLKNLRSVEIRGSGDKNTVLRWNGSAGGTAFKFLNCYRTVVRGIRFDRAANDPVNLVAVIEDSTQGDYDATAPSQFNVFEDCTFKNGAVGLLVDFVTNDIMNDSHKFVRNRLDGQTQTGFSISGQNAMALSFYDNYSTSAPHAVQVQTNAGSFKWYGGYVNSTISNFDFLSYNTDGYSIIGVRSESSPRFLSYTNASATPCPVYIAGVAYSAANLNADTFAINSNGMGPFTIVGGSWGLAGEAVAPRFSIANNSTNPIPVAVIGNSFGAVGANTVTPVPPSTGNRVFAHGNRFKIASTSVWSTLVEESFAAAEREVTITYTSGVAMNMDASQATIFKLVVSDTVAVTMNAPTNGTAWQSIKIQIKATAAMNAANPFAGAGWKAGTVPIPTNGNGYIYVFMYDGVSWYQVGTPNLVAN
jgi:hypothetical protein